MRLPKFEYFEPESLKEALALLSRDEGNSCLVAGGTELYVKMKQRLLTPRQVVNLKTVSDPDFIHYSDKEGLRIGALATLESVESAAVVQEKYPGLAQAAGRVASPAIRNTGTIGGNVCLDTRCWYYNQSHWWRKSLPVCFKRGGDVCHVVKGGDHCYALCLADTAPILVALEAKAKLLDGDKQREVELKDFFTNKGEKANQLKASEILSEIQIAPPSPHTGSAYLKYSTRGSIDFPILGVAVVVSLESKKGRCKGARIVLGGVDSGPVIAEEAAEAFKGKEPNDKVLEEVSQLALKGAHPVTHMGTPASYKREIIPVFVRRAIKKALEG